MSKLEDMIKRHEGLRLHAYPDTFGNATIGYGHLITADDGDLIVVTEQQAEELFQKDLHTAIQSLEHAFDWFPYRIPDDVRVAVLIDLAFNLGINRLKKFKKMLAYLQNDLYALAADEMKNSIWHKQTGDRALELEEMMRSGEWQ